MVRRTPLRLTPVAVTLALVGSLTATAHPASAAAADTSATIGPLQSGTSAYIHGTYTWTDYAYDDLGANTSAGGHGAATYPAAQDQSNAADLIQLQASLVHQNLEFTAVLETLTRPDEPLLGIGLDTDRNTTTGSATVPGGAWKSQGALGLDYFITASSDGTTLLRWVHGNWVRAGSSKTRINTRDNTLRFTLSLADIGSPHVIRAVAAVGLRRPQASWLTGAGPIYDLAFVRAEAPTASSGMLASAEEVYATKKGHATGGEWAEVRQADVLAGHLPSSNAVATISFDAMRQHLTALPPLETPGYHSMLYHSNVALPEGIVDGTAAGGLWAGPYQPYLVQVPPHPTPDLPALLYLHGGGNTYLDNGVFAPQGQLSIGRSIAVFPYGRETTTADDHGYNGVSEQDILDVLSDARRNFATDPTRTLAVGVSTGGGGAFRMTQLHPDLFSGVLVISAYDDTHLPENDINLPIVFHNGGLDPAVSPPVVAATQTELDGIGDLAYTSFIVAAHSHADPTGPITQCQLDRLLRVPVQVNPPRVVLGLDPGNDPSGLPAGTHLNHDRAYWVSGVHLRPDAPNPAGRTAAGDVWPPGYGNDVVGKIDVTSLAFPDRMVTYRTTNGVGQNVTGGADLCGPNSRVQSDDIWRIHSVEATAGSPQATTNGAMITVRQVASATLDLTRMRLTPRQQITLTIDGDGTTSFALLAHWPTPQARVTTAGRKITLPIKDHSQLTFSVAVVGRQTVTIAPGR